MPYKHNRSVKQPIPNETLSYLLRVTRFQHVTEESGTGGRSSSSRGSGRTPANTTSLAQSIERLDGSMTTCQNNYNIWRFRIVRFLMEKAVFAGVRGPGGAPAGVC